MVAAVGGVQHGGQDGDEKGGRGRGPREAFGFGVTMRACEGSNAETDDESPFCFLLSAWRVNGDNGTWLDAGVPKIYQDHLDGMERTDQTTQRPRRSRDRPAGDV